MIKYIILLLNLFLSVLLLFQDSVFVIGEFHLYGLLIIMIFNYFEQRTITLLQVWLLAFVFIIVSESILIEPVARTIEAVRFLFFANNLIVFGYYLSFLKFNTKRTTLSSSIKPSKLFIYIIILFLLFYIVYRGPRAIMQFSYGRKGAAGLNDSIFILGSFTSALAYLLPSVIAYYFKVVKNVKSILPPLMVSMPIFIILFIGGTRFPLLFSFGGFLIVSQTNYSGNIRINLKVILLALLLVGSATIMRDLRNKGIKHLFANQNVQLFEENQSLRFSEQIASKMSSEGIIDMTELMMNHFDNNPHMNGKSSAFITYFWIPRAIWPNKPTMLGNWLIRKYRSGFGESHSSSFGFTGDLYADFGYFSLVVVFFIGMILRWADGFRQFYLSSGDSFKQILAAMLYSYVFFFVRSPQTSTFTFLSILLLYGVFRKLLFKRI